MSVYHSVVIKVGSGHVSSGCLCFCLCSAVCAAWNQDLADAFLAVLSNPVAYGQVFNISGPRYVTFDGIALACAEAMGLPKPQIVHYNPKDFDFGKSKAFPLRDQVHPPVLSSFCAMPRCLVFRSKSPQPSRSSAPP